MNEDGVAGLHAVGTTQQIGTRQPLQHHRRTGAEIDRIREIQQAIGRHAAGFAIGADGAAGIGDAVAGLDVGDTVANRFDDAGTFEADPRR